MKDFKKNKFNTSGGNRGGDRGGFRENRYDGGFGGRKEMHQATCAKCGKSCEVPFRPNGQKPVYCSNCFDRSAQNQGAPAHNPNEFRKRDFGGQPPFRKPEFRQDFKPMHTGGGGNTDELKRQIDAAHVKLDKLLQAVHDVSRAVAAVASSTTPPPAKETIVPKAILMEVKKKAKTAKKTNAKKK